MNKEQEKDIYEEGEDWHSETVLALHSQVKVNRIVSVVSLVLACITVFSISLLIPLKTVAPYVIEVNKSTGETKVLKQYNGDIETISINEILSKYWINRYLIARESYSPNTDLEENYLLVQHLSEGIAFKDYSLRFTEGNTESPFIKYGDDRVRINIISISFLRKDTASIRYELIQSSSAGSNVSKMIDILKFKFTKTPETEKTMLTNPLGFKVTEFRTDREVIN